MNIILTGNRGFIGSQVELLLNAGGHQITGIDSLEPQVHSPLFLRRLRAGEHLPLDQHETVIHLAAMVGVGQSMYEPANYVECNSLDTALFLQNLTRHKPKRLVVASSMSIYGEGCIHRGAHEGWMPDLRSIYALTKFDQEQLCLIWGEANDVEVVALRFFNTYGPGQSLNNPYTGVMAIFGSRLLNGKAPVIYEDGEQTRDFIHVSDVAAAVVHCATQEIMRSGVYNVGTGIPTSIRRVATMMAEELGVPIEPVITNKKRAGDIRHCYADIDRLLHTGWTPKVKLDDGLRSYCEWLRTQRIPVDKFEVAASELEQCGLVK
jgi:dTDP-L-rhamnose 4-epimerase